MELIKGSLLRSAKSHSVNIYRLSLRDGANWLISGSDENARKLADQFAAIMNLEKLERDSTARRNGNEQFLTVSTSAMNCKLTSEHCFRPIFLEENRWSVHIPNLVNWDNEEDIYVLLVRLSLVFAREVQSHEGILIHGALAEFNGNGVIMAAAGGTGKTTASNRLPLPWISLSDDAVLIVKGEDGLYWAHPWPTWSRFIWGEKGGKWNVQRTVPLRGIFFLDRDLSDWVEPIGAGESLCRLMESATQISSLMERYHPKEKRPILSERFNNVCAIAKRVPAYLLHISLTGNFWREIEKVL